MFKKDGEVEVMFGSNSVHLPNLFLSDHSPIIETIKARELGPVDPKKPQT